MFPFDSNLGQQEACAKLCLVNSKSGSQNCIISVISGLKDSSWAHAFGCTCMTNCMTVHSGQADPSLCERLMSAFHILLQILLLLCFVYSGLNSTNFDINFNLVFCFPQDDVIAKKVKPCEENSSLHNIPGEQQSHVNYCYELSYIVSVAYMNSLYCNVMNSKQLYSTSLE